MGRHAALTDAQAAEAAHRLQRGERIADVAASYGTTAVTIDRSVKRVGMSKRGVAPVAAPAAPPVEGPEAAGDAPPEEIPGDAALSDLRRWIGWVNSAGDRAQAEGNTAALTSLAAKRAMLADQMRKALPPRAPDPNDNPDFAAAKERARKELQRLVAHPLIAGAK